MYIIYNYVYTVCLDFPWFEKMNSDKYKRARHKRISNPKPLDQPIL